MRTFGQLHRFGFSMIVTLLYCTVSGFAGEPPEARSERVLHEIRSHFGAVTAELSRHESVTIYGETISGSSISAELVAREIALFKEAVGADLFKSLPRELFSLGHNLIIHDSQAGDEYLKALHALPGLPDPAVGFAFASTLAAGERGEAMAVSALDSSSPARRSFWARYLAKYAIYRSSVGPIEKQLAKTSDIAVDTLLLRALSAIGSPEASDTVKSFAADSKVDELQAAALFTYVELLGFDAIPYVESCKPIGPKSSAEQKKGLEWLKRNTRPDSKHGRSVGNDPGFANRFADLSTCATIAWLEKEGLLEESAISKPTILSPEKKKRLLALLVDSKGFGLEAVKGSLFLSLSKDDEPDLLRIRAVSFYSPNAMSEGRAKTIGILVRHLRQEVK